MRLSAHNFVPLWEAVVSAPALAGARRNQRRVSVGCVWWLSVDPLRPADHPLHARDLCVASGLRRKTVPRAKQGTHRR